MRTLRLARIAAEAEGLRLQRMARRIAIRLAIALVALAFIGCAFVLLHVGIWFLLRIDLHWQPQTAGLAMAGFDFVVGLAFVVIAATMSAGRVEREAAEVRRRAWGNATGSVAMSAMLLPALRLVVGLMRRLRGR